LLRGFHVLAKSVPEGAKFRNTPSACGGDRNFEDFASLFFVLRRYGMTALSGNARMDLRILANAVQYFNAVQAIELNIG
jgi:hypothetical protein